LLCHPTFMWAENRLMNSLIRNGKGVNMQLNAHGYIEIYLFQHNRRAD